MNKTEICLQFQMREDYGSFRVITDKIEEMQKNPEMYTLNYMNIKINFIYIFSLHFHNSINPFLFYHFLCYRVSLKVII